MRHPLFSKLLIGFTLIIHAGCGGLTALEPTTESSETSTGSGSKVISAEDGGSVTSSDGKMTLTIPAGALDEDTEITITPVETDAGTVYEFQPDGLVFNEPATATYKMDAAEMDDVTDENGDPLDTGNIAPSVLLFLVSEDGSTEVMEDISVKSDEDSSIIEVSTPIPHFTGLVGTASNGSYAYMTSLGTHYVGSDFKADATVRYLGDSSTRTYLNMSLSYTLLSSTVTQLEFTLTGAAIKHVSPNPITRNAYLNRRGQESATRPKFNCNAVGSSTVEFKATLTSIVEVVFQPENKTRVYTVNHTETSTRKGKCIARVGMNDFGTSGDGEGTMVAMLDPVGDVLTPYDGALIPALELDMMAPALADLTGASVEVVGDTLIATLNVDDIVPGMNPDDVSSLCYHLLILDDSVGDTGFAPYYGARWDLSASAIGPGAELEAEAAAWGADGYEAQADSDIVMGRGEDSVSLSIPLSSLDMTATDIADANFRAVAEVVVEGAAAGYFVDVVDL